MSSYTIDDQICSSLISGNVPWHLRGSYSVSYVDEMLGLIGEKLPRLDFPVKIGSTGYIVWPNDDDLPSYGYTLDNAGRIVGIVDEIRFFQRYTGGCLLVGDMGTNEIRHFDVLSDEDEDILRDRLNMHNGEYIKGSEE